MGATSTYREPGITTLDFFRAEFPLTLTVNGTVLASAVVRTGESARYGGWPEVFYAAVKGTSGDPEKVWALIVLMVRSGTTFTYKEMDEGMGPAESSCPARILDLLSPTTDEYALEWRDRCWEYDRKLTRAKNLRPGNIIELAKPIEFQSGQSLTRLTLVDKARGTWRSPDGFGLYRVRLNELVDREFQVIA